MAKLSTTAQNIDWELALKVLRRCIEAGSPRSDQDEFIAVTIPLAKVAAERKASRYRGKQLGIDINEDTCLSAALEGLRQIACRDSLDEDTTPDKLRNLCASTISCRFVDLEREVMGRDGKKTHPMSLDVPVAEGESRDRFRKDLLAGSNDYNPDTQRVLDTVRKRLKGILSVEQYRIMDALITMRPQGYTLDEVAEKLGKHPGTLQTTANQIHRRLRTYYPEIEKEMTEALGDTIRAGTSNTRPSRFT